jgi:hypothetical protein
MSDNARSSSAFQPKFGTGEPPAGSVPKRRTRLKIIAWIVGILALIGLLVVVGCTKIIF